MKYIDADKIRNAIESEADNWQDTYTDCMRDNLITILDSLQQEQPDCHTVEDWIQHIKNADQLTKDIFSKGPYDVLYDALNHPYRHCYDAIKEFGELCFQVGVNSVKQEQPEVDLNAEIEKELRLHYNDDQDVYWWNYLKNSFYHFYELGLNAKEE